MSAHPIIEISVVPIELCKLLKIANMVSGGGEAKIVISEGYVLVNNEVEYQKRKKIRHGDIIEFNSEVIEVAYSPSQKTAKSVNSKTSTTKNATKKKKSKNKTANISSEQVVESSPQRSKRRPISF